MIGNESVVGRKKRHVEIGDAALPRSVLLPGDPARVPLIGSTWDKYEEVSFVREYRLGVGTLNDVPIAACSTGIGGPSTEIAVLELAEAGPDTFIRVGTCAALQEHIKPGDLVIQHSAVRLTGTVDAYINREFPSVADLHVTNALIAACEKLGVRYHVGMTASVDSFYGGQDNPLPIAHLMVNPDSPVEYLRRRNVATFEMEAATLFALGSIFGLRTGSVCAVGSNRVSRERLECDESVLTACKVASLAALALMGTGMTR